MIKLQKEINIKTETYTIDPDYYVDIITNQIDEEYQAWIYNTNYGVKQHIIGMKICDVSKQEFIKLVEANILDDIHYYKLEVEDPEVERYAKKTEDNINQNGADPVR